MSAVVPVPAGGAATVAALYIDPNGVYKDLPGVEVWDEARDARLYAGPWPVVAHPPCARWCALAGLVQHTHGYRIGDDGGCFEAALRAVRTYGGVLEHPAYSKAWKYFGLPRPSTKGGWTTTFIDEGASCYVEQENYGHPARKPTWLYAYGVELTAMSPNWRRASADDPGWYVRTNAGGGAVVRVRHGEQRMRSENSSRSPVAFRDVFACDGPLGRRRRGGKQTRMSRRKPTRAKQLGVTDEQYDAMLKAQGGGCAICGNPPKTRRLDTDHDHRTGDVRGLLCHRCNRALPTWVTVGWLVAAIEYLERHAGRPTQAELDVLQAEMRAVKVATDAS